MTIRFHLLTLVCLLGFGAALDATAQQHRATRLGDPATRFSKPLQKPEHLRQLLTDPALYRDVESVLEQAGWQGDVADLRRAAASADIIAVKVPVGTRLPFMSTRHNGKPIALIDVLWAGKQPISAYAFEFSSRGRRYRCLTPKACANFLVEDLGPEAAVQLVKAAPADASRCAPFETVLRVVNVGGKPLSQVRVTDTLPPGLTTVDNRTEIVLDAGALAPGEGLDFRVPVVAAAAGTYANTARVTTAEGATSEASASTTVRAPALAIECTAPGEVLLARPAEICITLRNTGDADEPRATVVLPIPAGATVNATTAGGIPSPGAVTWDVVGLPPGASRQLCATLTSSMPVNWSLQPTAVGVCSPLIESRCTTRVAGVQGVLLEVVDLEDPIEVGNAVTYEIRVTNQGSRALNNVRLTCTLPAELEFVSATGATPGTADGQTISTEPLPTLEAKAETRWRIVAKALGLADARFKVELTSDEFSRPVEEWEATLLY